MTKVWRVLGGPGDLVSGFLSRVIRTLNGVTLIITLLITDLLSPPGLQVGFLGSCFNFSYHCLGVQGLPRGLGV